MSDVVLENEEFRERLGIDKEQPLDASSIRKKKQVREEQALALNRELTREVCRCYFFVKASFMRISNLNLANLLYIFN